MASDSLIFIGSSDGCNKSNSLKALLLVTPKAYFQRIFASFIPPFTKKYKRINVDLLGPMLAVLFLAAILTYGTLYKSIQVLISPSTSLLIYSMFMPLYCFILCKLGLSDVTLCEVISLVGYSLYGHILTLMISLFFYHESSNTFFFLCLILFSGSSTFRLAIVLLKTIPLPPMRFIVCSSISVIHILFLIFIHFAYMHKTFEYGIKNI